MALETVNEIFCGLVESGVFQEFFGSRFIQTLIAAFVGAWAAFRFQRYNEAKKILERKIQLINFSMISLASNLETLINFKKQIALPLEKAASSIGAIPEIKKFIETGEPLDPNTIINLDMIGLAKMNPEPIFLILPDLEKLAGIAGKHPDLIRFGYGVNNHVHQFSETNKKYNEIVKIFSKNFPQAKLQDISLILSLTETLVLDNDDALFFIKKMESVFNKICDETLPKNKRKVIYKMNVQDSKKVFLPPDDHLKGFGRN